MQQGHKKLVPTKVCNLIHFYKGGWIITFDHCVLKCKSRFLFIWEQKTGDIKDGRVDGFFLRGVRSFAALQRRNFCGHKRFDGALNSTTHVRSAMLTGKPKTVIFAVFLPGCVYRKSHPEKSRLNKTLGWSQDYFSWNLAFMSSKNKYLDTAERRFCGSHFCWKWSSPPEQLFDWEVLETGGRLDPSMLIKHEACVYLAAVSWQQKGHKPGCVNSAVIIMGATCYAGCPTAADLLRSLQSNLSALLKSTADEGTQWATVGHCD